MQQHTSHILMIRPVNFGYNPETAVNNRFQVQPATGNAQQQALAEFDNFVSVLRSYDIDVTVVDDTPDPHTPDSLFPNNWISFHEEDTLVLYPMFAANRRKEKKETVLNAIREKFQVRNIIDLTGHAHSGVFLEGTGSMVLDRIHRIAYACLSPRTDETLLKTFCSQLSYEPLGFHALDASGEAIYHTNVMMCVADQYAVVCLESINDAAEKTKLTAQLNNTQKEIIPISFEQMNCFAGNMLQVHNSRDEKFLVMSSQAYHSLNQEQKTAIETYNPIMHAPIPTIETNGGGSARCMMAEVFLTPGNKTDSISG